MIISKSKSNNFLPEHPFKARIPLAIKDEVFDIKLSFLCEQHQNLQTQTRASRANKSSKTLKRDNQTVNLHNPRGACQNLSQIPYENCN